MKSWTKGQKSLFNELNNKIIDLEQQLKDLNIRRNEVFENWKKTQQDENNLLSTLSQKYGDGSLSLKDGTFKPIVKQ